MKLVTISGPIGAGKTSIIERIHEKLVSTGLCCVERNGHSLDVVEDILAFCPRAVVEATPTEVRGLEDMVRSERGAMLRIFICAPRCERRRRLLGVHLHESVVDVLLKSDSVPACPPAHLLYQPIFDLIIPNERDRLEATSSRIISVVGRFLKAHPALSTK